VGVWLHDEVPAIGPPGDEGCLSKAPLGQGAEALRNHRRWDNTPGGRRDGVRLAAERQRAERAGGAVRPALPVEPCAGRQ
jgi:hypothetical protein